MAFFLLVFVHSSPYRNILWLKHFTRLFFLQINAIKTLPSPQWINVDIGFWYAHWAISTACTSLRTMELGGDATHPHDPTMANSNAVRNVYELKSSAAMKWSKWSNITLMRRRTAINRNFDLWNFHSLIRDIDSEKTQNFIGKPNETSSHAAMAFHSTSDKVQIKILKWSNLDPEQVYCSKLKTIWYF